MVGLNSNKGPTLTLLTMRIKIQSKGYTTVFYAKGAGCTAASIRRAGAIFRKQTNDRNSLNIPLIAETPTLADSWEQAPYHSVEQSRRMSDPSLLSLMKPCYRPQAVSAQAPIILNPELTRCSKRCPRLAGASSVAYPAWGEEVSKKPPGLRQATPPPSSKSLRG
jgi:hypothetical protein